MEINNRKIIGKLYQELKEISNEDFYVEEGRLCTEIVNYLDDLSGKLPYSISFSTELEVSSLFKLYDLKLDVETESLLQKLIEYLQIMSSLCSIKLIVLVNIKHYLNNTQILELYKTAFYCKISLFLIEAAQKDILTGERVSILETKNPVFSERLPGECRNNQETNDFSTPSGTTFHFCFCNKNMTIL